MKKILVILLSLTSLNLVAEGPVQISAIFPNYIGYVEFSNYSAQTLFDAANELFKEDADEVDMKIDSKNNSFTIVFSEPIDDDLYYKMTWNLTFSQNRINYVISSNIFKNGEDISTTFSKEDSDHNKINQLITEILNELHYEVKKRLSSHQYYENVVWKLDYWQFNPNGSHNRSTANERIIFQNGTMIWDGQEYGKSETATYIISGKRINLSSGKWFDVQSCSDSKLVLVDNHNIIRTFKK